MLQLCETTNQWLKLITVSEVFLIISVGTYEYLIHVHDVAYLVPWCKDGKRFMSLVKMTFTDPSWWPLELAMIRVEFQGFSGL